MKTKRVINSEKLELAQTFFSNHAASISTGGFWGGGWSGGWEERRGEKHQMQTQELEHVRGAWATK